MEVEQKPFTQKRPQQLVYLELGSGNGGMLLSISEEGFRFRAVTPVRPDGPMPFAFSLDGVNRLEGSGEIESLEDDGKSGGLRFTEVSADFRAKLTNWLSSDSSCDSSGREVTPAAAPPLDTMEKIRQEIRAGSSISSREPQPVPPESISGATPVPFARPSAEKKSAPSVPARKIPERNIPERAKVQQVVTETPVTNPASANWHATDRPVIERIIPEPNPMPPFSERLPEAKETPNAASRLLSQPTPSAPETEKPAALASAFLKLARETKTRTGTPVAPAAPAVSIPLVVTKPPLAPARSVASSALFVPATPIASVERVMPDDNPVTEQPRRYVPALDVSLDVAWENAKLTSPPEPPHLSRAAAGGIITIALAVIIGALAFNFRQEIGAIFIQLGQRISGNGVDVPAPDAAPQSQPGDGQNAAQTSRPPESQPQSAPANSGNASKAVSASPKPNAMGATSTANSATGKIDGTINSKSGGTAADGAQKESPVVVPPIVKARDNSAAQIPTDSSAKSATPVGSATGQEEFDAAREILRGKNRAQELSRAVELLWSAVKKGNVAAEVALGDLYRRGDGVEKSCDQARVLLVAASKKGSVDARHQLEQMAEQGCE